MKTTKKLSLSEIKVESFVTNLNTQEKQTVGGGTGETILIAQTITVMARSNGLETFCFPILIPLDKIDPSYGPTWNGCTIP